MNSTGNSLRKHDTTSPSYSGNNINYTLLRILRGKRLHLATHRIAIRRKMLKTDIRCMMLYSSVVVGYYPDAFGEVTRYVQ